MRYRMLDVRIWCDEKFRSLTPLKPNGQALFIYLLTNPHTTSIPGLYRAGAGAMAEELAWSLVGFNRALKEIVDLGLVKADLKARVMFIPNAIKYNKPQSPNVVRSWSVHWDEIPECSLKNEAYCTLQSFIKGLGKAFVQAFDEVISKHYTKNHEHALLKTYMNQEQEQEQKQEQKQEDDEIKEPELKCANTKLLNNNLLDELNSLNHDKLNSEKLLSLAAHTEFQFPLAIPLINNDFYQVSKQEYDSWQRLYPKINVVQELQQLISWNNTNPTKRKQRVNILRHIHSWLDKKQHQKATYLCIQNPVFPVTFEHNLNVAKKWLTPIMDESEKCQAFQVLKGQKV